LGAINETHVCVKVSRSDALRFCGRKNWPTKNTFVACDFDMKFTYILGGCVNTQFRPDNNKMASKKECFN